MRAEEFIKEEEQLDEILPLLAVPLAVGAAKAVGGVGSAVGGLGKAVGGIAKGVGSAAQGVGKAVGATGTAAASAIDAAKDKLLQPGKSVKLPTGQAGGPTEFKVKAVKGDEVELENPEGTKSPSQPNSVTYKKADVKRSISV